MERKKIYNQFFDIYGNEYNFKNYIDFSEFWFNTNSKILKLHFGANFKKLNNLAIKSKESKIKIYKIV